jgi:hypothetical protein
MLKQLHSATDLDFQLDVALYSSLTHWYNHFVYSLTGQTAHLVCEKGQRSG